MYDLKFSAAKLGEEFKNNEHRIKEGKAKLNHQLNGSLKC